MLMPGDLVTLRDDMHDSNIYNESADGDAAHTCGVFKSGMLGIVIMTHKFRAGTDALVLVHGPILGWLWEDRLMRVDVQ